MSDEPVVCKGCDKGIFSGDPTAQLFVGGQRTFLCRECGVALQAEAVGATNPDRLTFDIDRSLIAGSHPGNLPRLLETLFKDLNRYGSRRIRLHPSDGDTIEVEFVFLSGDSSIAIWSPRTGLLFPGEPITQEALSQNGSDQDVHQSDARST